MFDRGSRLYNLVQLCHGRCNGRYFRYPGCWSRTAEYRVKRPCVPVSICVSPTMCTRQNLEFCSSVWYVFCAFNIVSAIAGLNDGTPQFDTGWRGINECRLFHLPRQLPVERWYHSSGGKHACIQDSSSLRSTGALVASTCYSPPLSCISVNRLCFFLAMSAASVFSTASTFHF